MKLRLGICFYLAPLTWALAQQMDSVVLNPVVVYGIAEEKYLAGSSVTVLDSAMLSEQSSRHLGEFLSFELPIYFRNYGSGMLSGISLRGTSPQHTAVLWNGININSFSLGQSDFSILPGVAFSQVKVHEGGGSARYGNGAFGGTVLLNTSSSQSSPLTFIQEAGSFGRFFTALKGNVHAKQWDFSTNVYHVQSQNDFPVQATDERQQHAAYHQEGIVQDIKFQWSHARSLELHYWYHQSDREIQPPIGQVNSSDEQQDQSHRLLVEYKQYNRGGALLINGGWVNDVIVYNGDKSEVQRWVSTLDHQFTFKNGIHTQAGVNFNHILGDVRNYENGEAIENRGDIYASGQRDFGKRLSVAINLRQPFVENITCPFLPYAGAEYALIKHDLHQLSLRGNVSKNFRVPTLNDRYWQNAGNPDLLPETSNAAEAGVRWKYHIMELNAAAFTQLVSNWIQWVPGEGGVYRPRNVKEVRARGLEFKLVLKKAWTDALNLSGTMSYQLTESVTTEAPPNEQYTIGKQLIYTPRHTANAHVILNWKLWSTTLGTQYSGKRYVDFSNAELYALDPFVLMDISLSRELEFQRHRFDLRFTVKNILNTDYQLYSGRAQPGRNFNFQLMYQLKNKQ